MKGAPWTGMSIATYTTKIQETSKLREPRSQYNYAARYQVERVSEYASSIGEQATLYFERRRNFDLNNFRSHMQLLLDRNAPRIAPNTLSTSRILEMAKGLDETFRIPDAIAHAGYRAVEPHRQCGRYERSYVEALVEKLWRGPTRRKNIREWGFVLMPASLWGGEFMGDHPWLNELPRT